MVFESELSDGLRRAPAAGMRRRTRGACCDQTRFVTVRAHEAPNLRGDVSEREPSAAEVPDGLMFEASPWVVCRPVADAWMRTKLKSASSRSFPRFDRVGEPCPAASTFRAAGEALIPS